MINRRNESRISVTEAGFLISQNDDKQLVPVRVSDVSFNGIGLGVEKSLVAGKTYMLKYSLLHRSFNFLVEIVWTRIKNDRTLTGCRKVSNR